MMNEKLNKIYDEVYSVSDNFKSHKDAIDGFENENHKYIYSINYIDAEIRNGGIYQLYQNSTWHLILDGIKGVEKFGFPKLSNILNEILFYYFKRGRSKMKRRISEEQFKNIKNSWDKSLADLEEEYYNFFDDKNIETTEELWEILIKNNVLK